MEPITPGRTAYEGYFAKCGGKSLISGAALPKWSEQSEAIRDAWEAAGQAVVDAVAKATERWAVDKGLMKPGA